MIGLFYRQLSAFQVLHFSPSLTWVVFGKTASSCRPVLEMVYKTTQITITENPNMFSRSSEKRLNKYIDQEPHR